MPSGGKILSAAIHTKRTARQFKWKYSLSGMVCEKFKSYCILGQHVLAGNDKGERSLAPYV